MRIGVWCSGGDRHDKSLGFKTTHLLHFALSHSGSRIRSSSTVCERGRRPINPYTEAEKQQLPTVSN